MTERATKKQQLLLEFIQQFIGEHGYGPSYREIMNGMDYKSVSTVATHIDGLIAKGWLRKRTHSARSLEIVNGWSAGLSSDASVSEKDVEVTATLQSKKQTSAEHELTSKIDELLALDDSHEDVQALIRCLELLGYSDVAVQYVAKRDQLRKKIVYWEE